MSPMTLQEVADSIRSVQDFPKPGILFFDIESIFKNYEARQVISDALYQRYKDQKIDFVAGFDARGFPLAQMLADRLQIGWCQIRKKGKLPPPVISEDYEKEYGVDTLEMEDTNELQGKRVILIDDLIATLGTGAAGVKLVERLGGIVVELVAIMELPELTIHMLPQIVGRPCLPHTPIHSLISVIDGKPVANREYITPEERARGIKGVRYCIDMITVDEDDTNKLMLLDRIAYTPEDVAGLAMFGGGIDDFESLITALARELDEEAGCRIAQETVDYTHVLIGADRDPRGPQVSYVFHVKTNTSVARPEKDAGGNIKGNIVMVDLSKEKLPDASFFAFSDHATSLTGYTLRAA